MAIANYRDGSESSSSSLSSSPFSVGRRAPVYSNSSLLLPPNPTCSRYHSPLGIHSSCTSSSSVFSPPLPSLPSSKSTISTPNPLTWYPLSPPSPPSPTALQLVQRFFDERSEVHLTATSDIYITATRKFYHVSDATYRAILHKFFSGDARPLSARIDYDGYRKLLIITLPGLPHELMSRFDATMQASLVSQGFLWPNWGSEWLCSSGATRITLTHGRRKREMEPDGGLQVLCQELPFLIVEVASSQDYESVLEKASWALKHSRGRIRYAVLIKLVNKTAKERRADGAQAEINVPGKRSLGDFESSSPTDDVKRVRTHVSSEFSHADEMAVGHTQETGALRSPGTLEFHGSSDLSSVSSTDSDDLPSAHGTFYPVSSAAHAAANHGSIVPYHLTDSAPPSTGSPSASTLPGSPEPSSSPNLPPPPQYNPRAVFSRAHLTVLGTTLTGNRRVVTTLLDSIELWPTPPGPRDVFSFSWDDMPTPQYPRELQGKRFTLEFTSLHRTLDLFVKTGDREWVRAHEEIVMKEWQEEVPSGTSGSGEGDGEAEEEEEVEGEEEGSGSDGEWRVDEEV